MEYRMVAIDLDDSLLDDNLKISRENINAVRRTIEKGVLVTIATGRMLRSALPYIKQLGIDVPVITYQGALVANAFSGDVLLHFPVSLDLSREIIRESKKNGIHLQVYMDDEYYFEQHNRYSDLYFRISGIRGHAVGSLEDFLKKEPTKLIMIDEPENILKWMEYYKERFAEKLQVTISKAHFLEFTSIEATKGNAVRYLAEKYRIKPDEVIAIGDSFNDIPMLTYAGLGVAMGNAHEIVKSHADYVTYSNNENGVAHVLEKFVLGGEEYPLNSVSIEDIIKAFDLEVIYMSDNPQMGITTSDINRPGLQLTGFFDYFASERVQVVGKTEMTYLDGLDPETRFERLCQFFKYDIPCLIVSRGMEVPDYLIEAAKKYQRPILRSQLATTNLVSKLTSYLSSALAPRITRHGVLVDVYGVGVFLMGESGIGKSETALELIKRGHRLVADDAVEIKKVADNRLIGEAPELIRHFMEIRGIGIIDIKAMYGVGAVINNKPLDLVIQMEAWDDNKEYDRLGLDEEYIEILGVKLPKIVLPVRPGRNLAIIVEVAARNFRLKNMGYHAARELDNRLNALIQMNRGE